MLGIFGADVADELPLAVSRRLVGSWLYHLDSLLSALIRRCLTHLVFLILGRLTARTKVPLFLNYYFYLKIK